MDLPVSVWSDNAYERLERWNSRNCPFKVKTTSTVWDGDWKTASIRKPADIPAGTELTVDRVFYNYEGGWASCRYNGYNYSVDLSKIEIIKK